MRWVIPWPRLEVGWNRGSNPLLLKEEGCALLVLATKRGEQRRGTCYKGRGHCSNPLLHVARDKSGVLDLDFENKHRGVDSLN